MSSTEFLNSAALILSIVNGVALLRLYIRDRPVITLSAVHPEIYQWWFRLQDSDRDGVATRRWGFIVYVGIANKGLRKTTVVSWRLRVCAQNRRRVTMMPINLPNPVMAFGEMSKTLPVLGQISAGYDGKSIVESGESISGMALYLYEVYGHAAWDPKIVEGAIRGRLDCSDVFGHKVKHNFTFQERPLEQIKKMSPQIEDALNAR